MYWKFALILVLTLGRDGLTAEQTPADPLGRATPRSAIGKFMYAIEGGHFDRASQYLSSRPSQAPKGSDLARQLGKVMDSLVVDVPRLSLKPEGNLEDGLLPEVESVGTFWFNGEESEITLVRVEHAEYGKIWLFSADTVQAIPRMYKELGYSVRDDVPEWLKSQRYLMLELWQWAGLAVLLLVSLALAKLILFTGQRIVAAAKKEEIKRITAGPVWLLLAVGIFQFAVPALDPPFLFRMYLQNAKGILAAVLITWLMIRLADVGFKRMRDQMMRASISVNTSALQLTRRTIKILVVGVGVLVVVRLLGYDVTAALAGLGIGGIAVALSAQKTLENLFGGVSIIADKTLRVGDVCKIGEQLGEIEDVGLRSTRIRTQARTSVIIPNGLLSNSQIENFGTRDKFLFRHTIGLQYETGSDELRAVLAGFRRMLETHPAVTAPIRVRLVKLSAYSLDLDVFAYIMTQEWDEFLEVQEELLLKIMDIAKACGASFAFPSPTLYMAGQASPESPPQGRT